MRQRENNIKKITLTGWNKYSIRFVDPPTWTWKPIPQIKKYVVNFATDKDKKAQSYSTSEPLFDMSSIWQKFPHGSIDMLILGFDSNNKETCLANYKNFFKTHDFDKARQKPMDWSNAIIRNASYLLDESGDPIQDFEIGLPRGCWSSMENSITREKWSNYVMPGLYHTSHIFAFLRFSEYFPKHPLAKEAKKQAKIYGDWLLNNRNPKDFTYSLFPFSNVGYGKLEELGQNPARGTTVTRAGRVGIAMLELYEQFNDISYFKYAEFLANSLVKFQRDDGSWPFRVNAKTGEVLSEYTSDAISPARLFALLDTLNNKTTYKNARLKAIEWMLNGPVKSHRWEGMYEDTDNIEPYINLENLDTNEMIRYLIHFKNEDSRFLKIAEDLNRWIEDQFVVWHPDDCVSIGYGNGGGGIIGKTNLRSPTPTVLEQFQCDYPMEGHTGNWLMSLIALHQATKKEEYLLKGIAAANSIQLGQQEHGAFSTWGFDTRFNRPLNTLDWVGDNACGHTGLILWNQYYSALQNNTKFELGLWGL